MKRERAAIDLAAYCQACRHGTREEVGAFLDAGADANESSVSFHKKENTPLMMACKHNAGLVPFLLEAGAKPRITNANGCTALHYAACYAPLEVAHALIDHGAHLGALSNKGLTVLMGAAGWSKTIDCVKMLLERGANVNAADHTGKTVLMYACANTAFVGEDMIAMLLLAGADRNATTIDGRRALNFTYGISPQRMKAVGSSSDGTALAITVPNDKCGDYMACASYAVAHHGLVYKPKWVVHSVTMPYAATTVWAELRTPVSPDCDALYAALVEKQCADAERWYWIGCEMQSFRAPNSRQTILHAASRCDEAAAAVALPVLMRLGINPHLIDDKGKRPLDVCKSPSARVALLDYMRWRPTPQCTRWFGPFFLRRARTFLLVCRRLGLGFPRDVRNKIVQMLAEREVVCISKFISI